MRGAHPTMPVRQSGFTLLEIVVAFVVFSLIFATTLQIMSGGLRNTQRAAAFTQAALWAQTKMDALGIDPAVEEGSYQGKFDDEYRWELNITAYEFNDDTSVLPDEFPIDLFYVELLVFWGEAQDRPRRAVFKTLRAATPERANG